MTPTRTVLVTGASGFVGSHLARRLADAGHTVRAMTRHPDDYEGAGEAVFGDVGDPGSLTAALAGADAAYYLVHSLDSDDFVEKDAAAARAFGAAAATAGLERIVYLGGLGKDDGALSDHLRSRREVEITRQLVDHLPVMITPKWTKTKTQPIALEDVLRYLVGVLEPEAAKGRTFEIGGPEVLRYIDMLERAATVQGKKLPHVGVPLLTPSLSSHWLSFVTDVDTATARNLVDSMTTEVVVHDRSIEDVVPGPTIGYDDSVRMALEDREKAEADST